MEMRNICCLLTLVITAIISCSTASSADFFTAAVYEHARKGEYQTDSADFFRQTNLRYYEKAAEKAIEEGADLILYPENGIFPHLLRGTPLLEDLLELIPDPKQGRVTPCDEADQYSDRPILLRLSCIAKNNEINVVANMYGREPCDGQPGCPEDDRQFHYSANVAFDRSGTLISRYYKERLFYEFGIDVPKQAQDPCIETDVGKFATFISFDIWYKRMAVFSNMTGVDAILYSTLLMNLSPFFTSIQWWNAFAMGNDATLLAANVQIPGFYNSGSGIYRGLQGPIVSAFNPDGSSKLMVATVPKRGRSISSTSKSFVITEDGATEYTDNRRSLPRVCSANIIGETTNRSYDYRCRDDDVSNYTLQRLTEPEGHVEVCNNGMCCELDYSADSMDESFYLGVFNGTRTFFDRYFFAEENCFLARCDDVNGTSCSHFVMYSDTIFRRLSMKSRVTTKYVYPSVMSSGMWLVPIQDWTFTPKHHGESSIEFNSDSGIRVLQATLVGRVYNKDPPYER